MATSLAKISIKDNSSWNTFLNLIYPVGSIYLSFNNTSPATVFGGTWSKIEEGRYLYSSSSARPAGTSKEGSMLHSHTFQVTTGSYATQPVVLDTPETWGSTNNASLLRFTSMPKYTEGSTAVETSYEISETNISSGMNHIMNSAALGTTNVRGPAQITNKTIETSNVDNFPPYYSVNCWKRTA